MTKKAFITGISGQDGSLLAEFLLSKDYTVYGLMRNESSKENLKNIIYNENLHIIYGNLLNDELIRFLLETNKFDEIYNLASQSNIRLSYNDPIHTFNVTLMGTIILLNNVEKYSPNSKMFQAGSSAMFGNSIDKDGFQRETTPFKPVSPYASSKLFAYNVCCNYRENNNLHISNGILYNHESAKSKTLPGVLNVIVKNALDIKKGKKEKFEIPDLNVNIDLGNAEDYVKAMWLILQQKESDDYIISSGVSYSLHEICSVVFNKVGLEYKKYIISGKNKTYHLQTKGDSSKLKNIGWVYKHNIDNLVSNIIINENIL